MTAALVVSVVSVVVEGCRTGQCAVWLPHVVLGRACG